MCECMNCGLRFDFSDLLPGRRCPNCGSSDIVDWDDPMDNPDVDPDFE